MPRNLYFAIRRLIRQQLAKQYAEGYRWRAEKDYSAIVKEEPHLGRPLYSRRRVHGR